MMNEALGHKTWCIPDLYMKEPGNMPTPSHESITLLNKGSSTAEVTMDLLFDHGRPSEKLEGIQIEPMQAKHLRMDHLEEWGLQIPRSVCYSAIIHSSEKIVVEYARLNWIDGAAQSFAVIPYYEN